MKFITLFPPQRPSIYVSLEIVNEWLGTKTDKNYLYRNKKGIYIMCINKDKVSEKLGSSCHRLGKELSEVIDESLKLYPRTKLF